MPRHKTLASLFLLCVGCVPESITQPPRAFLSLEEDPSSEDKSIADFADQIDSADVLALSGRSGRAEGLIDSAVGNQTDIDVLRVIATPGRLLRILFLPGSAGAALQPFLVVTDSSGRALGLHDGAIERSAEVDVVVPTQSSLFIILQDTRNAKENGRVGGVSFDYIVTLSEEDLNPEDLGLITTTPISSDSALSPGAGLALYSFQALAGKKYSITVDPAELAEPGFIPFLAFYSPSFELGSVMTTDTPLQPIQNELFIFGTGETDVLFGVSDFSGGFGDNYLFTVSVQEQ